ncbi:MAG: hypothetical protein AVDCRST_MAG25-2254, partial [uncultured Rubrobacteraceae bacterium]
AGIDQGGRRPALEERRGARPGRHEDGRGRGRRLHRRRAADQRDLRGDPAHQHRPPEGLRGGARGRRRGLRRPREGPDQGHRPRGEV